MANHASAIKRTRSDATKRALNRYQHKSCRTAIKKLRQVTDPITASTQLKSVNSMIDKLSKRRIIHKNKGGGL